MAKFRTVIHGAAGRMGRRLIALGTQDPDIELVAAVDAAGHDHQGDDAGTLAGIGALGLPITDALPPSGADVVIDFSHPAAAEAIAQACEQRGIPLLVATTGLSDAQNALMAAISESIPVLVAPNTSLAVNLLFKLTGEAAQAFAGHDVDVEILERHHRFKEDSPSGTALKFGEIIAAAMGQTKAAHGREGRPGARPRDEIGYHAIRVGDNTGEHTIVFGMLGELVELSVKTSSRDCYAIGALAAAKWLASKGPGMYLMSDVLGL